jgi:hypothetical protein
MRSSDFWTSETQPHTHALPRIRDRAAVDRKPAALQDDLRPVSPAPGTIAMLGTTPIHQILGTKEEKRAWRRAGRRRAHLPLS